MSDDSLGFTTRFKKKTRMKLLIYPKFQLSLIWVNGIIMSFTLGAVGLQALRTHDQMQQIGRSAHLPENHPYFKFIELQSNALFSNLAVAMIAGFAVSTLLTLVISNRLAGPILRLEKYFRQIAKGTRPVPKLTFRRGDYFEELPPAVNEAFESLRREDDEKKAA